MMRKSYWAGFAAAVVLSLSMTACKDTKTLKENDQLKAKVAELQKENGELGNRVEAAAASSENLAAQNEALKKELNTRRVARPAAPRAAVKAPRRRRSVRRSRR